MDREKIINNVKDAFEFWINEYEGCNWPQKDEVIKAKEEALELLKEQEAVEPKKVKGYYPPMYTLYEYECKECKTQIMNKQPFCMGCGKPVAWDVK